MKERKIICLATAFLLAMMTFIGVPRMAETVYADNGDAAMQMGASALSTGANTTGAQVLKYGGQNWYVIGYADGRATLLATTNLGYTMYDFYDTGNAYGTSTLKTKVDEIADGFSLGEQAVVVPRTLTGGNPNYGARGHNDNDISGHSVNALLWPLSVAEADNVNDDLLIVDPANQGSVSSYWWLRSPGFTVDVGYYSACVNGNGFVNYIGLPVNDDELGVRPAFYLDLQWVLFTSAAAGGESSGTEGADALTAVGTNTGNEWKVTFKGLAEDFAVSYCAGSNNADTEAVTVKYTGAEGNYISAIVTDSSGETIKKYGKIAAVNGADGIVTINTAGKMDADDKLFVFCEQDYGNNATGYASDLKEIMVLATGTHIWRDATCTEPKTCEVCGMTEGEPTGHDWGEWKVTKEATVSEEGAETRVCKNDPSHTETRAIAKKQPISIEKAVITGVNDMTYTGKPLQPKPKVILNGTSLKVNNDYKITYKNNRNVGTATMTITGIGNYCASVNKTFKINKAANPMTVKVKTPTAKASKKTVIKKAKAFTVSKAQGKVKFKKTKGNSRITVASNGSITVKKGLKKGKTYSVKVKVTAAGGRNYKEGIKTVTLKIKIK